jgi:hypothetical protein
MADLFGAPLGIMAKEESNRATLKSGLEAVKTMGEIAAQPVEMAYKQSLTRTHTAAADAAELAATQARQMQTMQLDWLARRQETQARQQMSEAAAGQGKIATVADLPPGKSVVQASQADDLEAFANFASGTMPPMELAKLRTEIAGIKQKEAAAFSSGASASLNQHKQQVAQFEVVGNVAGAAAANESNYRAIMMSPQRQLLPRELTGNWRTDAPVLRAIEMASQDSIKRANLARELADSESKRRLDGARVSESKARVTTLELTQKTLKRDYEQATKSGGKYSQEALDLKKAQTENAKSLTEARNAKMFPPMPLDPELIEVGKTYTGAGGVKYDITGLDAKGNPIGRVHVQGSFTAPIDETTDTTDLMEETSND